MERETTHFLEAVAYDRPVMVDPHLARVTMEVYLAADLSAELNRRSAACQLTPADRGEAWALAELYTAIEPEQPGGVPAQHQPPRPRPARHPPGRRAGRRPHVERVVGAEQHVLGTEPVDQLPDHCGVEDVRVEVQRAQVVAREPVMWAAVPGAR